MVERCDTVDCWKVGIHFEGRFVECERAEYGIQFRGVRLEKKVSIFHQTRQYEFGLVQCFNA